MLTTQQLLETELFELLNLQDLPDDEKAALVEKMNSLVTARVIERIAAQVTEAEAQNFSKMAESNDEEGMKRFLSEHQINMEQLASEEAVALRIDMAQSIDVVKNMQQG